MNEKPTVKILGFDHYSKHRHKHVKALCSCGNKFVAKEYDILSGHTSSCGCWARKVRAENIRGWNKK